MQYRFSPLKFSLKQRAKCLTEMIKSCLAPPALRMVFKYPFPNAASDHTLKVSAITVQVVQLASPTQLQELALVMS